MTLKVSPRLCVAIYDCIAEIKRNAVNGSFLDHMTDAAIKGPTVGELLKLGKRTLYAIDNNAIRVPRVSKHVRPRLARYLAEASGD